MCKLSGKEDPIRLVSGDYVEFEAGCRVLLLINEDIQNPRRLNKKMASLNNTR